MVKFFYYSRLAEEVVSLSRLLAAGKKEVQSFKHKLENEAKQVRIITYCIMPTHLHMILQQKQTDGISKFMNRILNSYSRFFNFRHSRKGPLWEKRFERIWVENDEHLLHETRYVHLNPVTAYLVENPEEWPYSSYREYIHLEQGFCEFKDIIEIAPNSYEKFVRENKENQRELARAKKAPREPKFVTA